MDKQPPQKPNTESKLKRNFPIFNLIGITDSRAILERRKATLAQKYESEGLTENETKILFYKISILNALLDPENVGTVDTEILSDSFNKLTFDMALFQEACIAVKGYLDEARQAAVKK